MFYARSACTAWVVLGWVAWVTVFLWGLKWGFVWEGIADFALKLALWGASWQLLVRIWEEIADFALTLALWAASWQFLARFWQEIADFALNLALGSPSKAPEECC